MSKKTNERTENKPFIRLEVDRFTEPELECIKIAAERSRLKRPAYYKQAILSASGWPLNG